MTLNIFITLCILGIDFLIYVLFQWTYGDKRSAMARKIAAHRNALKPQPDLILITKRMPANPTPSRYNHQRLA